jgi:hypothetical protein
MVQLQQGSLAHPARRRGRPSIGFLLHDRKNLLGNRLVPFFGDNGHVRFETAKRDVMA